MSYDHSRMKEILGLYLDLSGVGGGFDFFGEHQRNDRQEKQSNHQNLKNGFYLVPIDEDRNKYSYLFKDGVQMSTEIFRQGGVCSGFKDGYCNLIVYKKIKKTKDNDGYTSGIHVIIDETAKIVFKADSILDYPYHSKGVIATMNSGFYSLLTGQFLCKGSPSVKSESFIYVQGYNNGKNLVYQIDIQTGDCTIIY